MTFSINVVALNLLISFLGDSYDAVQASLQAHHCRIKADKLIELGFLMFWQRGDKEQKFIHYVHYSNEMITASAGKGEDQQWEGRIKVLVNQLKDVKDLCKDTQKKDTELNQQLKRQMTDMKQDLKLEIKQEVSDIKDEVKDVINKKQEE